MLCLPGDQSHLFAQPTLNPLARCICWAGLLGLAVFPPWNEGPNFGSYIWGARPGSGKPLTQYQPQREVSPAGIEIYVICCLFVLCFGTHTGLVGIREVD